MHRRLNAAGTSTTGCSGRLRHCNVKLLKRRPRVRLEPGERAQVSQWRPVGDQGRQAVCGASGIEALRSPSLRAVRGTQRIVENSLRIRQPVPPMRRWQAKVLGSRRPTGRVAESSLVEQEPGLLHFHGDDANVTALRVVRRLYFVIPNARVLLLRVPMHEEKSARILLNRGSELLGQTSRPRGKSPEICPSDFKSLACQPPHQPLENRYEYRVGRPIGYQCRPQHHSVDQVSTGVSGNLGCCMSSRCITLLARAPAAFERIRGTSSLSPMACKGLR